MAQLRLESKAISEANSISWFAKPKSRVSWNASMTQMLEENMLGNTSSETRVVISRSPICLRMHFWRIHVWNDEELVSLFVMKAVNQHNIEVQNSESRRACNVRMLKFSQFIWSRNQENVTIVVTDSNINLYCEKSCHFTPTPEARAFRFLSFFLPILKKLFTCIFNLEYKLYLACRYFYL